MQFQTDTPTADVVEWAVNQGASGAFVRALLVESNHLAFTKARDAARADADGEEFRARSGHFVTALWNGNKEKAFRRADIQNRKVLATAGLAPDDAPADAFVP